MGLLRCSLGEIVDVRCGVRDSMRGSDDDSLTQLAMSVSDEEYLFLTMVY